MIREPVAARVLREVTVREGPVRAASEKRRRRHGGQCRGERQDLAERGPAHEAGPARRLRRCWKTPTSLHSTGWARTLKGYLPRSSSEALTSSRSSFPGAIGPVRRTYPMLDRMTAVEPVFRTTKCTAQPRRALYLVDLMPESLTLTPIVTCTAGEVVAWPTEVAQSLPRSQRQTNEQPVLIDEPRVDRNRDGGLCGSRTTERRAVPPRHPLHPAARYYLTRKLPVIPSSTCRGTVHTQAEPAGLREHHRRSCFPGAINSCLS